MKLSAKPFFVCMRQGTTYEYFATCPVGEDKPLPYVA